MSMTLTGFQLFDISLVSSVGCQVFIHFDGDILEAEKDIQMPDFVRKLIDKRGLENVKMPYLIKKMLEKKYGKKYD